MTEPNREPMPIGVILILRDEFAVVEKKVFESPAITRRARILRGLLDELIERREKEATDVKA